MPQPKKKPAQQGLDGQPRTIEVEDQINDLFASLFSQPSGTAVLNYLRSITIEMVAGPEVTDAQLRHLEGQRYLVGLISRRINAGVRKRGQVNADTPTVLKEPKDAAE